MLALSVGLLAAACSDSTEPAIDHIEIVQGADQTGGQGVALADTITIRVVDHNAHAIPNAAITWRIIEGGGRVLSADSLTGSDGEARAVWELGPAVGQNLLLASARGATVTVIARSEQRIASVFAGGRHTCALTTLGEPYCWGSNDRGELGDGTLNPHAAPVRVKSALRFRTLALGWSFTCGITPTLDTYCWGDNTEGQLGTAGVPAWASAVPVHVATGQAFSSISAGYIHACGIAADSTAYCWGSNARHQLGNGGTQSANVPVRVAGSVKFRQVSTGDFHTCGIASDTTAYCWGASMNGEVGSGVFGSETAQPTIVAGGTRFKFISAGTLHTCAVATDGSPYCWGRSSDGENGAPQFVSRTVPGQVSGAGVLQAVATGNVGSCGLGTDIASSGARFVYCWGSVGPLRIGPQAAKIFTSPDAALAEGFEHACTIRQGAVWCWGANDSGQLGVSGIASSTVPVRVNFSNP